MTTRNFCKEVTIATAIMIFMSFLGASVVPIIGPGLAAYFSGRMQYFIRALTNLEIIAAMLIGELILSLIVFIFWQPLPIAALLFIANAISSMALFFIGLKLEIRDQKRGISI